MRRLFVIAAAIALSSCDAEGESWSDEPGIEYCETVQTQCECIEDDQPVINCSGAGGEAYWHHCEADVRDSSTILALHSPLLGARLAELVALGVEADCQSAFGGIDAWRYE